MLKKVLVMICISLCLALSLAFASTSLPISFNVNHNDEAASSETNGLSTIEKVYSDMSTQIQLQNQTVRNEDYSQYFPIDTKEYKTDRFIVKFKNTNGRAGLVDSLGGDFKNIRYFKNSKFGNFNVIMTKTKINKEDFMTKAIRNNAANEIAYIQPDYKLSTASLDANTTAGQKDASPDNPNGQVVVQPEGEDLPDFLEGLPLDDPLVQMWLENNEIKKNMQKDEQAAGTFVDMADVNLKEAWEKSRGEETVVAILDTGIDITHQNISQNIWTNLAETPGNGIDDDGNGYIDDTNGWNFYNDNSEVHRQGLEYGEWHGTHLAGIIAGVAPEANIMPLKVFTNGTAYTSDIIEAINYAENNGAKIANCSWGTSYENLALREAIEKSDMLFVCAAGNSNCDIDINPVYPASYNQDNIITVASLNKDGNLSGYSNYGKTTVDVAAPGENIISTTPGDRHGMSSGTSQSAAFVTGEAALVLGEYKNTTALGLRLAIIESSDKLPSLNNQVVSGNKINCGSAVSTNIPKSKKTLIREDNEDISVSDSVYRDISVTDPVSSVIPESGETLISENNEDISVSDSVYQDISVTDPVSSVIPESGETLISENNEDMSVSDSVYQDISVTDPVSSATPDIGETLISENNEEMSVSDSVYQDISVTDPVSSVIPESGETLISENNEDMSVSDAVYQDPLYGETAETVYGNPDAWDSDNQDTEGYSLYSGEIWNIKASMPTARCNLAATKVNGKIYAIGGDGSSGYTNKVEEYDPATNTWTTKASISTSRSGLAAAAVNGKIYAIGGRNYSGYLNTVEEYDPVTNTWSTKTSMPTPRYLLAAAAVDGKIYAIGGNNSSGILDTVEEYDPVTNTWTTKASMPTPRNYLAAAVVDAKIYAIGGMYSNNSLSTVEEYNPVTNTWTTKTGMPMPRYGLSAAAANGNIYAIGGKEQYDGDYLNRVQLYSPATDTWTTIASMPTSRDRLAAAAIGNRVYAIGGYGSSGYLNTVEELVLGTDDYGDDFLSSITIVIGSPVEGWIDYVNDIDVFDFSPVSSGTYIIESSGVTDMCGELYDSNQTLLTEDDDSGSDYNFKITVNLQASQTYYLKTREYSDGIGPYGVTISQQIENITASSPDSSTIILSWDPVSDAAGYDIEVDGTVINNGSSTTYIHSGLLVNVVHIYRVRVKYADASGGWSRKAYALTQGSCYMLMSAMPTPRYELAAAAANGKICAIGGWGSNGRLSTVEEYDPGTNIWTAKASMPTSRYRLAAAAANGKIYAIGGYGSSGYLNTVEEYDPATDTWTAKTAMPTSRYRLAAAAANGKIYAIGGYSSSGYSNKVEEYNPATNTWATKASMPTSRSGLAAAAANGKIYAIGGYGSSGYTNKVEEYDPVTNTWTEKAAMPTSRYGLAAAVADGKIYAIGGYSSSGYLNTVEEYDPVTNTWAAKADMPIRSYFLSAAALNDKVYAIGGYNTDGYLDCAQELNMILATATNYFYDSLNRLNTIVAPDKIINYQYDDNGNLIQRTINQ